MATKFPLAGFTKHVKSHAELAPMAMVLDSPDYIFQDPISQERLKEEPIGLKFKVATDLYVDVY